MGDRVLVKNFSAGELWLPGCIVSKTGSVPFTIKLNDGRVVNRHLDQLRKDTTIPNDTIADQSNNDLPAPSPDEHSANGLRHSECVKHPPQRFVIDIN